jgi:hypothetical protein
MESVDALTLTVDTLLRLGVMKAIDVMPWIPLLAMHAYLVTRWNRKRKR